jgi:hypothetical protein
MTDFTTFYIPTPDPVKVAIDWLKDHQYIVDNNITVAGDLKGYGNSGTWVTVSTPGGPGEIVVNRLHGATLDINCYADTKSNAYMGCSNALAALRGSKGQVFGTLVVTGFDGGAPPQDLTDPVNSNYRFVSDIDIIFRSRNGEN